VARDSGPHRRRAAPVAPFAAGQAAGMAARGVTGTFGVETALVVDTRR
jgi:hypothetical protein